METGQDEPCRTEVQKKEWSSSSLGLNLNSGQLCDWLVILPMFFGYFSRLSLINLKISKFLTIRSRSLSHPSKWPRTRKEATMKSVIPNLLPGRPRKLKTVIFQVHCIKISRRKGINAMDVMGRGVLRKEQ